MGTYRKFESPQNLSYTCLVLMNLSLSYSITWTLINFENDLFNETRHRWAGIWRFSASRSGTKSTSLKYKLILITQAWACTNTYIKIVHVPNNHQRAQSPVTSMYRKNTVVTLSLGCTNVLEGSNLIKTCSRYRE